MSKLRALLDDDDDGMWCDCDCPEPPDTSGVFARQVAASVLAGSLIAFVEPVARAMGRSLAILLVERVEALAEEDAVEVEIEPDESPPKRKRPARRRK